MFAQLLFGPLMLPEYQCINVSCTFLRLEVSDASGFFPYSCSRQLCFGSLAGRSSLCANRVTSKSLHHQPGREPQQRGRRRATERVLILPKGCSCAEKRDPPTEKQGVRSVKRGRGRRNSFLLDPNLLKIASTLHRKN